jgi:hypothetical protein
LGFTKKCHYGFEGGEVGRWEGGKVWRFEVSASNGVFMVPGRLFYG